MNYSSPERLFCPDCYGLLVYVRQKGRVNAYHDEKVKEIVTERLIPSLRLPHTKRTLDRAKREAKCGVREGPDQC